MQERNYQKVRKECSKYDSRKIDCPSYETRMVICELFLKLKKTCGEPFCDESLNLWKNSIFARICYPVESIEKDSGFL